jgi:hypothetical protein
MKRSELIRQISQRLDGRQLVWVGTRGDDIESACDLPEMAAAFSFINAYSRRSSVESLALEDITGVRVDLDVFDIDADPGAHERAQFRRALLSVLARRSALFTYRPSTFVSAACFARRDRCRYLGLFGAFQSAFDHKPWVETSISDLGLPHVPWHYIADEEQLETLRFLEDGPVMLRKSRSTGGVGLVKVDDARTLASRWPRETEAYVSVAPYIDNAVPINVGAVVWSDGTTLHPASVQLIGIQGCTERPFGYCGNDFGAVADLDPAEIESIHRSTLEIGSWLHAHGYRGAFGADYLLKDGEALFTEINPRFQGSTHASCRISVERDVPCIVLEHLGALLGLPKPEMDATTIHAPGPFGHFVVHAAEGDARSVDPSDLVRSVVSADAENQADVVTRPSLQTDPGATIARFTVRAALTQTGFQLAEPYRSFVGNARTATGVT